VKPAIAGVGAALALILGAQAPAQAPAAAPPAPRFVTKFTEDTLDGGRFGTLHRYVPAASTGGVALLLSGDEGWQGVVVDAAHQLASEGYLVGGVDVRRYLAANRASSRRSHACAPLAADLVGLSYLLQRGAAIYRRPVLLGYSNGASLVYAALTQAQRGLFTGGISLGFCPSMDLGGALPCARDDATVAPVAQRAPAGALTLTPDAQLAYPWTLVHGDRDPRCDAASAQAFVRAIPSASLLAVPQAGHELADSASWWPRLRRNYQAMRAADWSVSAATTAALRDLPITEVPATASDQDTFAVMISGDGGWAEFDQQLSAKLASRGVPVAGLSSIKYFWHERTPEGTAADVARMLLYYGNHWHKRRALLIGYSFGADVLPAIFNRLPAGARDQVASMTLLGLSPLATYEVVVGEWLPGSEATGVPVLPEFAQIGALPTLCVHGSAEKESLCPQLHGPAIEVREIGVDHHFSGRVDDIADAMLALTKGL